MDIKNKIFISHSSEDKDSVARPLAEELIESGFKVWYDEYSLFLGDNLKANIDLGLSQCDYTVMILSKSFFSKYWTREELDGVAAIENVRREKVLLPILHNVSHSEIIQLSPTLAGKKAIDFGIGLKNVVKEIINSINEDSYEMYNKRQFSRFKSIKLDLNSIDSLDYSNTLNIMSDGVVGRLEFKKNRMLAGKISIEV